MKIIVFTVVICAAVCLENVSGTSISPYRPNITDGSMCALNLKICTEDQYLGLGPDGCPKCLHCTHRHIVCANGVAPIKIRKVENQCPTYYCRTGPVRCSKEMKYCAEGQHLGTGSSGCRECLPCPIVVPSCPVGSTPRRNPTALNQCRTYSCTPRCVGERCFEGIKQ